MGRGSWFGRRSAGGQCPMSRRRWPKCWCWSNGPPTPDTLARYGSNPPSVSGRSKLGSTISRSSCGSRPHGAGRGGGCCILCRPPVPTPLPRPLPTCSLSQNSHEPSRNREAVPRACSGKPECPCGRVCAYRHRPSPETSPSALPGRKTAFVLWTLAEALLTKTKLQIVLQPCSTSVLAGNQNASVAGSGSAPPDASIRATDVEGAPTHG